MVELFIKTAILAATQLHNNSLKGMTASCLPHFNLVALPGLFAGLVPRVTWISVGGAVFFGVYEKVSHSPPRNPGLSLVNTRSCSALIG